MKLEEEGPQQERKKKLGLWVPWEAKEGEKLNQPNASETCFKHVLRHDLMQNHTIHEFCVQEAFFFCFVLSSIPRNCDYREVIWENGHLA